MFWGSCCEEHFVLSVCTDQGFLFFKFHSRARVQVTNVAGVFVRGLHGIECLATL